MTRRSLLQLLASVGLAPLQRLIPNASAAAPQQLGDLYTATNPYWKAAPIEATSAAKVALIKRLMDNALDEHERLFDEAIERSWREAGQL